MRPAIYGAYHHITVLGKENEPCDHTYDVTGSLCENCDKFAVDRKLDIVGRFQLAVPHMVFFHPHECSVLVGFGHTSAVISNSEQLVLVLCPLRPQAVQLSIPLLPFALALSYPVNKFCIWRKLLVR